MTSPLTKLREEIAKNKLDAMIISSIPNIIYLTNYSGFSKEEREAYLFITKTEQYLLTDGRYTQAVKNLIPNFKLIEISSQLSTLDALTKLAKKLITKNIGFEGGNVTHLEHTKLISSLGKTSHIDLRHLRIIKTTEEISKIEKACTLGDKTFDYILKEIKLGTSEKELATKIEIFIKGHFADISFNPIVAFGKNSAIPHHVPSDKKLISDQFVLLDFGVKLNNYCSDMTRTIFFGKATAEQKKIYNTVFEAQTKSIDLLNTKYLIHNTSKKMIKASDIDNAAREHIISARYKTIPHSLGHGIGIEVHEAPNLSPKSKDILKESMVFSIEPGIYLPDLGGVRIEDLVVLEKTGPRLLTHSKKNFIEL